MRMTLARTLGLRWPGPIATAFTRRIGDDARS
jgi:hypothetical protein